MNKILYSRYSNSFDPTCANSKMAPGFYGPTWYDDNDPENIALITNDSGRYSSLEDFADLFALWVLGDNNDFYRYRKDDQGKYGIQWRKDFMDNTIWR